MLTKARQDKLLFMSDDYPLHFGGRNFTGAAKYVATVIILLVVALLYLLASRWLQKDSLLETEMDIYGEEYYPEEAEF